MAKMFRPPCLFSSINIKENFKALAIWNFAHKQICISLLRNKVWIDNTLKKVRPRKLCLGLIDLSDNIPNESNKNLGIFFCVYGLFMTSRITNGLIEASKHLLHTFLHIPF